MAKEKFTPVDPKTFDVGAASERIKTSVSAATPSERRSGSQWYERAHRDATRVGAGMHPGNPIGSVPGSVSGQGYKEGVARPGRERLRGEQLEAFHSQSKSERQQNATRGAGLMSVLSPSSPAGMNYEMSVPAAHAATKLTSGDMLGLNKATAAQGVASKAEGARRAADNAVKKGIGSPDVQASTVQTHEAAKASAGAESETARAVPRIAGTTLKHAGNNAIAGAHAIASGEKTPEQVLPMDVKTGSYYSNIKDPRGSVRATVDGRSHDVAVGRTLGWNDNRGLGAKGRYGVLEGAHQQAASDLGMRPNQAQAVSWVQSKHATDVSGKGSGFKRDNS